MSGLDNRDEICFPALENCMHFPGLFMQVARRLIKVMSKTVVKMPTVSDCQIKALVSYLTIILTIIAVHKYVIGESEKDFFESF